MTAGRILGVGYPTLDHVWQLEAPLGHGGKGRVAGYFRQPGGQVPTALVALQRWGWNTSFLGPFGDDDAGREQLASLAEEQVEVLGSVCRGASSQTSFISIDQAGERTIHWYRPAELAIGPGAFVEETLDAVDAVLLDGEEVELALRVAQAARRRGALVMVDIDDPGERTAELLAATTHAVFSGDFAQRHTGVADLGEALRALCAEGPEIAVATLGAAGAILCSSGELQRVPAFPVDVVDTTSAGDVFHAAFLHGALRGEAAEATLRRACAAGGLTCASLGGRRAIPSLAAVESLAG